MEKKDFKRRIIYPVGILVAVAAASWGAYNLSWRLDNRTLHQIFASVSGTLLFFSVTFGVLFIYPATYFRGASLGERVLASYVTPLLWATKECVRLYVSFSIGECIYYYLNPLNIWLFLGIVAQMGLAEILCRWVRVWRGEQIRILGAGPLAAFVIGLFLVIFLFAWGQGENAYVAFLSGYRILFGSGI
jgi:hypothetical protein